MASSIKDPTTMIIREKRVSGHSIAEYALLMFLIVLISMPALEFLGSVFDSAYRKNEPVSQADKLFSLLGPGGGVNGSSDGATAPGQAMQPLSNLQINFSRNGMVKFQKNGSGSVTNSAEGTLIMAGNLQLLSTNKNLTQEQREQIGQLSTIAFELAEAERLELQEFPEIEQGVFPETNFFHGTDPNEPDVWSRYQQFGETYNSIMASVEQTPELQAVKEEIEANSAVISQTAYHNFIKPQFQYRQNEQVWAPKAEAKLVEDADVDVAKITRQQTPGITTSYSNKLRKRRL